jgi:hypothetical protein
MFGLLKGILGSKSLGKLPNSEITKSLADVLPEIRDLEDVKKCRILLHRTSPEASKKIIAAKRIVGKNSAVSFSINAAVTGQSDQTGSILVFEWTVSIKHFGDPEADKLLHVLSPDYIESMVHRPSKGRNSSFLESSNRTPLN